MVARADVVRAVIALTLERGAPPSIAEVAASLGLSKQGVLHHFPSRAALDAAVLADALARVDAEMAAAARRGDAAATYLRLSAPTDQDRAAALVLVALLRQGDGPSLDEAAAAVARWEALLAAELGDPVRARVVRLVGDGLFGEALLTGQPPTAEVLDELVDHLVRRP